MDKKEIPWFLGTLVLAGILVLWIFGMDGLKPHAMTDINVYDTYYVVSTIYPVLGLVIAVFFWGYLLRMLLGKFRNRTANLIFLISDVLMIMIFTVLIFLTGTMIGYGTAGNSPQETPMDHVYHLLLAFQFILVLLLGFGAYRSGLSAKQVRPNAKESGPISQ